MRAHRHRPSPAGVEAQLEALDARLAGIARRYIRRLALEPQLGQTLIRVSREPRRASGLLRPLGAPDKLSADGRNDDGGTASRRTPPRLRRPPEASTPQGLRSVDLHAHPTDDHPRARGGSRAGQGCEPRVKLAVGSGSASAERRNGESFGALPDWRRTSGLRIRSAGQRSRHAQRGVAGGPCLRRRTDQITCSSFPPSLRWREELHGRVAP